MRFSTGRDAEDRLISRLRDFGCKLLRDDTLDHEHKLDFVVLQIPEFPRLLDVPLGVQMSENLGKKGKPEEFFRRVRENPYTPKNLYIKLDPDLDLEKGGAFLVLVAITQFLLDARFKDIKIGTTWIHEDLSYEFREEVDVRAPLRVTEDSSAIAPPAVQKPETAALAAGAIDPPAAAPPAEKKACAPARPPVPPIWATQPTHFGRMLGKVFSERADPLRGTVTRYDPEANIGTIEAATGIAGKKEFFVHKSNFSDPSVLLELEKAARAGGRLDRKSMVPVLFEDGGSRPGKKNNVAINIRHQ